MTARADLTADEWALLRQAPVVAVLLVAAADKGGTAEELASIAYMYGEVRDHLWDPQGGVGFLDELILDGPDLDRSRFGSAEAGINVQAVTEAAPSMLREAIATLERSGNAEDLERYRGFIAQLARRAAEAHREGGCSGSGASASASASKPRWTRSTPC